MRDDSGLNITTFNRGQMASDAMMCGLSMSENLDSLVPELDRYFKAHPLLGAHFLKTWVWHTTTLVFDFDLNGFKIGVNIAPAVDLGHPVEFVWRSDRHGFNINLSRYGRRGNEHIIVFSHPCDAPLGAALAHIEHLLIGLLRETELILESTELRERLDAESILREGEVPGRVWRQQGVVTVFEDYEQLFRFFVINPFDVIQKHHLNGKLYENEELQLIQSYSKGVRTFFDIGSNVGNHAVFMAKVLGASKVLAFEANPFTAELLKINVQLNELGSVIDMSCVGIGLGEEHGEFTLATPKNNLGATRLIPDSTLSTHTGRSDALIPVRPLDSFGLECDPEFVKIDVEGMEIAVLKGMDQIIRRARPHMFIEVDNANAEAFDVWVSENDYVKAESFKRYKTNENFLIVPL